MHYRPAAKETPPEGSALQRFSFHAEDFTFLSRLVKERCGIVLGEHKRDMVYSRLARRLRALGIESFTGYCAYPRRTDTEPQASDYFSGARRYYEEGNATALTDDAMRYGAFAMERLINEILKRGGRKASLEIKLFGGGNVIESSALIGSRNAQFVKEFLTREGLSIAAEHLGDSYPRRIHYYPDTGKVQMRMLKRKDDLKVVDSEKRFANAIRSQAVEGEVELFQ